MEHAIATRAVAGPTMPDRSAPRHGRPLMAPRAADGTARDEEDPMQIGSTAFEDGSPIPAVHTCDGEDRSPPLAWSDPPSGTDGFALVVDDPDAPAGTWVHWVVYGIPADRTELPEGVRTSELGGVLEGENDFGKIGWGGPCPPPGAPHRYVFTLHALDARPDLEPGASKAELLDAIEGHVLGRARLIGTYRRGG